MTHPSPYPDKDVEAEGPASVENCFTADFELFQICGRSAALRHKDVLGPGELSRSVPGCATDGGGLYEEVWQWSPDRAILPIAWTASGHRP
jgi:hypothetical protein